MTQNSVASLALSGRSIAIGKIIVDLVSQLLVRNNQVSQLANTTLTLTEMHLFSKLKTSMYV